MKLHILRRGLLGRENAVRGGCDHRVAVLTHPHPGHNRQALSPDLLQERHRLAGVERRTRSRVRGVPAEWGGCGRRGLGEELFAHAGGLEDELGRAEREPWVGLAEPELKLGDGFADQSPETVQVR